jgi:broad specificity phosphatase PhoE
MGRLLFITHPEVAIDPATPVPDWPLSTRGVARMEAFAQGPLAAGVGAVWSSAERKARDGAAILGRARGLAPRIEAGLHENDRSATGYLPPERFWPVVEAFFARPDDSVLGWERAVDAQARVVAAVARIDAAETAPGDVALVAHGGVGALLLAAVTGQPISRTLDQPVAGGGAFLTLARGGMRLLAGWRAIEG